MRKIVAAEFVSLDGVVESPEKWTSQYFVPEIGEAIGSQMAQSDTLLLGRRTYQEFAAVWPGRGTDDPVGNYMNNSPKLVVSTTLNTVEWQNSTLITGDVAEELTRRKRQPGRNLNITGSATLVRSLLHEGLLDELHLLVVPIVLGSGKRLFEDVGKQLSLELVDSRTFSTGVLWLTYSPAGT